jgi:LAO/AO transport system kinase
VATSESINDLVSRLQRGETRAVARAARFVDDRRDGFVDLLKAIYPLSGQAYVVGVTGTPGAGKSTLVDQLVRALRARALKVGVVAVDPTSPYSGGAILGDRIRMQRHFLDPGVFIRSLATRGHLGGVSRSASGVIHILDAAGFDVILVETVGVGQDELEVARLAHTTLVIMSPGMGDDIQAIKAGILEVADIFVINKADRDGADATVRDLEQMISLDRDVSVRGRGHSAAATLARPPEPELGKWQTPIVRTVATRGEGIDALLEACDGHRQFMSDPAQGKRARRRRIEHELYAILSDTMLSEMERRLGDSLPKALDDLERKTIDPYSAAERLLAGLLREET